MQIYVRLADEDLSIYLWEWKMYFPSFCECCEHCQQTTLIGGLAMQRFTHSIPCSFPASSCISWLVHPKVTGWLSHPTLMVSPVLEFPGAWLRPYLRLHYSPASQSCPLPFFAKYWSRVSCSLSSTQDMLSGIYICDISKTQRFPKSTFSFRKMPFKSLGSAMCSWKWLAVFIKPPVMPEYIYECFMVCSCETAIFQWIPLLPSSPGTNKTFLVRVGGKQTPREQFPPIF